MIFVSLSCGVNFLKLISPNGRHKWHIFIAGDTLITCSIDANSLSSCANREIINPTTTIITNGTILKRLTEQLLHKTFTHTWCASYLFPFCQPKPKIFIYFWYVWWFLHLYAWLSNTSISDGWYCRFAVDFCHRDIGKNVANFLRSSHKKKKQM